MVQIYLTGWRNALRQICRIPIVEISVGPGVNVYIRNVSINWQVCLFQPQLHSGNLPAKQH
ncbi:hypothetical protein AERO8C_50528 [Aeromonas veronii]|uniref:Uncharacterized protein n=1 Tax=Aeromonas veronii TaxID=654 RepID=A0A653LAD5_AERVE|nr:hypothetical protein AERO8C_50528 [Aeromonas veronii]